LFTGGKVSNCSMWGWVGHLVGPMGVRNFVKGGGEGFTVLKRGVKITAEGKAKGNLESCFHRMSTQAKEPPTQREHKCSLGGGGGGKAQAEDWVSSQYFGWWWYGGVCSKNSLGGVFTKGRKKNTLPS